MKNKTGEIGEFFQYKILKRVEGAAHLGKSQKKMSSAYKSYFSQTLSVEPFCTTCQIAIIVCRAKITNMMSL